MTLSRLALPLAALVAACAPKLSHQRVSYADGTPHWEYEVRNGVPDGTGRVWYPNGKLRSQGPYVRGAKHGTFVFYDDTGAFEHQALFVNGAEEWRSDDVAESPPHDKLDQLVAATQVREATFASWNELTMDPVPRPYFPALDPAVSAPRIGIELGTGDVRRMALFASYASGNYGGYGQLLQTDYNTGPMQLDGKRTLEVGAFRRFELAGIGMLAARVGVLAPVGNDNSTGYYSSAYDADVRPSDAAASFPSAFAARSAASLVRTHAYYVLAGDAGIDWLIAGQEHAFDAVARANVGIGAGVRSALATVQLTNAISLSDPARRLDAVAFGATFWVAKLWVTTTYSLAFSGAGGFMVGAGHDL